MDLSSIIWIFVGEGGLLKPSECRHMGRGGLKLLKKTSYDIWTFPKSRPTCNSKTSPKCWLRPNYIPFHSQLVTLCKTQQNCSKKKSSNLPMVFESLTLTFNLLTGYYSRQQPSSLQLGNVIFLGMECVGVKRILRFFRRREHGYSQKFFSGFRRKHLIITTHVEKQYTRSLSILSGLRVTRTATA